MSRHSREIYKTRTEFSKTRPSIRCDALKQRQRLLGAAKIDFLEASEQLEAL